MCYLGSELDSLFEDYVQDQFNESNEIFQVPSVPDWCIDEE